MIFGKRNLIETHESILFFSRWYITHTGSVVMADLRRRYLSAPQWSPLLQISDELLLRLQDPVLRAQLREEERRRAEEYERMRDV